MGQIGSWYPGLNKHGSVDNKHDVPGAPPSK